MLADFIAQLPPTPTLMAQEAAPISLPSVGAWGSTDEAIQMWNQNITFVTGAQYVILAALVIAAMVLLVRSVRRLRSDEEDTPQPVKVTVKHDYRRRRKR